MGTTSYRYATIDPRTQVVSFTNIGTSRVEVYVSGVSFDGQINGQYFCKSSSGKK